MSVKRGPLSKSEIFYIKQNPENLSSFELATVMNRNIKQIEKIQKETPKETTTTVKSHFDTVMGRKERNGKPVFSINCRKAGLCM